MKIGDVVFDDRGWPITITKIGRVWAYTNDGLQFKIADLPTGARLQSKTHSYGTVFESLSTLNKIQRDDRIRQATRTAWNYIRGLVLQHGSAYTPPPEATVSKIIEAARLLGLSTEQLEQIQSEMPQ